MFSLQGLKETDILRRMISTLSITKSMQGEYSDLQKNIEGGILVTLAVISATGKQGVDCLVQAGAVDSLLKVGGLAL